MVRIIVCGGRDYIDFRKVDEILSALHAETPIVHLFHGNAKGADTLAATWASQRKGISVHPCTAQWAKYGNRAGPIRNQKMLGHAPDLVVAFPGGRGTADMVSRARKAGVPVKEVS